MSYTNEKLHSTRLIKPYKNCCPLRYLKKLAGARDENFIVTGHTEKKFFKHNVL